MSVGTTIEAPQPAAPEAPPEPVAVVGRSRDARPWGVVALVFAAAAVYHALQSRAHVTPAVFTDELLFSKLAQSLASGDPPLVRGEPVFFPSLLPVLLQAPAWAFGDVPTAYAVVKELNAVVMSSAAFPAYWLARQLVRPWPAVLVALATVAAPGMLYQSYLLSEPLAYPVFLLAVAVMARALVRPSRARDLAVVAVSLAAAGTRIQFAVLPIAFAATVAAGGRAGLRRHRTFLAAAAVGGLVVAGTGGLLLGPYAGLGLVAHSPTDVLEWIGVVVMLMPFGAGWLVVPGAAVGLATLLANGRRGERRIALLLLTISAATLVEVGVVNAVVDGRALERYVIYLVPFAFVLFLAYVERGAPWRRAYTALALALGLAAWLVPFPALADIAFTFTSPTLSTYSALALWLGHANAATIFSGGAFAGSLVLAVVRLRGRAPALLAGAAIVALFSSGVAAYAADHGMTRRTLAAFGAPVPNWLDRARLGPARYLELPGASPSFGWVFEAWNRNARGYIRLASPDNEIDDFAVARAVVLTDGTLLVDGVPVAPGVLVVNEFGSRLAIDGRVEARPRAGLSAIRVPAHARVRSLADGLYFDGSAAAVLEYRVWPRDRSENGAYRVALELPARASPRTLSVDVGGRPLRRLRLEPGRSLSLVVPARGRPVAPLRIVSDRAELQGAGTPLQRYVAYTVRTLEYVPANPGRRRAAGPGARVAG